MLSTFEVLALPARREILAGLRGGPATVGELAAAVGMRQPVLSKQLRILREAGFVSVRAEAQWRWYQLQAEPFAEVAAWLEPYRWMWEDRLDLLGSHLDRLRDEEERNA